MAEEHLMTVAEYDAKLRQWTQKVHTLSSGTLKSGTHGKGDLEESLKHYVDQMRSEGGRHIAFRFEPYGVFRQYGAGRGWVVINGVLMPGYRVVSLKDRYIRANWGEEAAKLLQRGYRTTTVREKKLKRKTKVKRERTPLDWLDGHIQAAAPILADIAQEYWGDVALWTLDQEIKQAKIIKK